MKLLEASTFATLERASPFLIVWLTLFALRSAVHLVRHRPGDLPPREGMVTSELPGLPLMLLHTVGFVLSVVAPVPLRPLAGGLGVVLLVLWLVGLARVVRAGRFREQPNPHSPDNLRDIVYLNEPPV